MRPAFDQIGAGKMLEERSLDQNLNLLCWPTTDPTTTTLFDWQWSLSYPYRPSYSSADKVRQLL